MSTVTGVPRTLPDELPLATLRRLRECFDQVAVESEGEGPVVDQDGVVAALAEFGLRAEEPACERLIQASFEEAFGLDEEGRMGYKEFIVLARNVYAPPRFFGQALRKAAGRGEVEAVKGLLDRGCDPNCSDGAGW